jgi:putative ABC transport system permease protein
MFEHFIKIAWRNLTRNKYFSFINIFGLSLGIACSLLIFLWVKDERGVDSMTAGKNVYNVYERVFSEGQVAAGPEAAGLLARELKRKIPDIKYATAFWEDRHSELLLSIGEKNITQKGCYADSDFFKIFNYKLLEGTPASALAGSGAIAISRTLAESLFNNVSAAFGKTIRINNGQDFKITAIFEDPPANASTKFAFALNYNTALKNVDWLYDWINRSPSTYIELEPGADQSKVSAEIKNFITSYLSGNYGAGFRVELGLQPFNEMYLHNTYKNGVPEGGRIEYVRLFTIIAIFILLIACINFMNLAIVRSVKRAKEVGIRKTVGALRIRLILQFIGEAMLLTFFAVIVALILVIIALPFFNALTQKQMVIPFFSPSFWFTLAMLFCITGIVAGSYPAWFLSSLIPVKILKGTLKFSQNAVLFRKGLVLFQFILSITLITGTIIISEQIHYVQTKNVGFDKDNLLYIPFQGDLSSKYQLFKQELLSIPDIGSITRSTEPPLQIGSHVYDLSWENKNPNEKVIAKHDGVGYGYLRMMKIPLALGRDFSKEFASDTNAVIINESALKMIGYKDPIGKSITFFQQRKTIIGVVKDFHLISLQYSIEPLILYLNEGADYGYVLVKPSEGKTEQAIAGMEKVFKQLEPRFSFRYYFADEQYQKSYTSELMIGKLADIFSLLAIFISCLGLLGLSMFTAEQRRKEIGVRKVIGASVSDIVRMLSMNILKIIILSDIISIPISWLAMNNWLQNYPYRIIISWWVFLIAGVITLLVALVTISFQSIKAALANPVKSLRSE